MSAMEPHALCGVAHHNACPMLWGGQPELPVATDRCAGCGAVPGDEHEPSCPEVSPALASAWLNARGAKP